MLVVGVIWTAIATAGCEPEESGEPTAACSNADSDPTKAVDYTTQVRPLLWRQQNGANACLYCHDSANQEGSTPVYLYFDTYQNLRKGSKASGPLVVVPGKPCASLLIKKVRGTAANGARMPRGGPYFTEPQVQLLSDWIAEGAHGED